MSSSDDETQHAQRPPTKRMSFLGISGYRKLQIESPTRKHPIKAIVQLCCWPNHTDNRLPLPCQRAGRLPTTVLAECGLCLHVQQKVDILFIWCVCMCTKFWAQLVSESSQFCVLVTVDVHRVSKIDWRSRTVTNSVVHGHSNPWVKEVLLLHD